MIHAASLADELVVFRDDSDGSIHLGSLAFDGEVMAILQFGGNVKRGFQQFDVFIQRAKEGLYPACNLYGASHEGFGRSDFRILPTDERYTSAL